MDISWSEIVDFLILGLILFMNYSVWVNKKIYRKFIKYFVEVSESNWYFKSGKLRQLIIHPNYIWVPRVALLIALLVHSYHLFLIIR